MKDLYKRLDAIFKDYTTHQWKNGWQHEADIHSKKLTIQNQSNWHNLFLLEYNRYTLTLSGPNGFKIEIDARDKDIRVDIECRELLDIDIYYYVDAKYWQAQVEFIVDICQQVYDSYTTIKNQLSTISNKTYGIKNPPFLLEYYRNRQIEKII